MESKGIGKNEPSYFISYALYFEKYERDFKSAEEIYLRGLKATKGEQSF